MARKLSMTLSDRCLCDEIKRRRLELGISQKDLAFAVGVSKNTVSAWECYLWTPSIVHICALTSIFDCTLNDLLAVERSREVLEDAAAAPEVQ